jgi:plastocyanin
MKEYIVTVNKGVDWREVHNDLINDTTADATIDSSIIPDRECECCNERAINNRNTHYHLSDEEATALRNDPRVMAVTDPTTIPEPTPTANFVGDFNRTSTATGAQANWGLKLHTSEYNPYQGLLSDPGMGDYNYALDGTGVDVVIVDTGIQDGHPEWEDADGVSRLQKINWFTESGVSGTQPVNFYTDTNGHGTHCIGTMAGKNFGWAKNARIYSITLYANSGNEITWNNMIDCLIGWHNNKSGADAGRPTVVNMSFQYSWFLKTNVTPNQVVLTSTGYDVTGGNYRGTNHTDTVRSNLTQYGVVGTSRPDFGAGYYMFGRKFASTDADVEQLINNGIHVCTAAGNNYMKIDHPGGTDYNNYLTFNLSGTTYYQYYHRGKSPSTFEGGDTFNTTNTGVSTGDINEGFEVGAIDASDNTKSGALDNEYNNGAIINVTGDGSDFFKREVTVNGVRVMGAGTVGGQTAVPDAWLEKVARMFELFTDPDGAGINEINQRALIKTLSGDTGTYHAGLPTIQRVARGAGSDYSTNFLTDAGITFWNLTDLFDNTVQNDMVWYLNSTGDGYGDGDIDAQEVIEHVFHTIHMHGLDAQTLKLYPFLSSDWNTGPLYNAMVEAYDGGFWDSSGYGGNAWKTDGDAFEVAAKEYLYLLNFCMFEYTELWDGGSLAPEWSDNMRTQAGIQANNPLGYALHNSYIAPVISKPSLATIRSIFQDGNTPAQDDPSQAGESGYQVDVPSNGARINRKANFSDTGPAVEIYTVGRQVISAQPNNQGSTYFADSAWRQAKYSGTSMAAPQMVGMMACMLQAHPDWTPAQVKNWFIKNSKKDLHITSLDDDYTDTDSVIGGPNRRAYFPLHGRTVFEHRERVANSKIFDVYFHNNGENYYLTGSDRNGNIGVNVSQPTLAFNNGDIVRFWIHAITAALHPLRIKTTQSIGDANQVTGVTVENGAQVWETAIDGAGSYGYQCTNHLSMWNTITVT